MTRADRITRLGCAGVVALLSVTPALSASPNQPVQGWSAMQGIEPAALLEDIQTMPVSEMAVDDQPYCADDAEIAATLEQDFAEHPVDMTGVQGTQLWGSDQLGTWTLVAPRADQTSCIIASGIGYEGGTDVKLYYTTAGLN